MVQINFAAREVNCKVVYYGPGRSGKTTNLEVVHAKAPPDSKGELVSIATETDRTLYFDFLPLDLGKVAGMNTKFQLYTVPGQVFYNATRKLVLQGSDGVIFVADSNPDMREENIESLENLIENLEENGIDIESIPVVFQWNKRDLPNAMPPDQLNADMNRWNCQSTEAIAVKGEGVFSTLKLLSLLVMKRLNEEYAPAAAPAGAGGAPPPRPAAAPPRPAAPPPRPAAAPAPRPAGPPPRPAGAPPPRPAAPPPRLAAAPPPRPAGPPRAPAGPPGGGPRPAAPPRPAPAGARGPAPVARRTNPLAEEIRRRKEMEARRAGQAPVAQPPHPVAKGRKGGAPLPIVAGVIVAIVGVLAAAAYFLGLFG